MNELYQAVWAQVFAQTWVELGILWKPAEREAECRQRAEQAAAAALRMWSHSKQDAAVTAKGQEP